MTSAPSARSRGPECLHRGSADEQPALGALAPASGCSSVAAVARACGSCRRQLAGAWSARLGDEQCDRCRLASGARGCGGGRGVGQAAMPKRSCRGGSEDGSGSEVARYVRQLGVVILVDGT
jgi:hypothetical protein